MLPNASVSSGASIKCLRVVHSCKIMSLKMYLVQHGQKGANYAAVVEGLQTLVKKGPGNLEKRSIIAMQTRMSNLFLPCIYIYKLMALFSQRRPLKLFPDPCSPRHHYSQTGPKAAVYV